MTVASKVPLRVVFSRPLTLPAVLAAGWSMRPRRGLRSLLPLPDPALWAWRVHTAYGSGDVDPRDVVPLVRWRSRLGGLAR